MTDYTPTPQTGEVREAFYRSADIWRDPNRAFMSERWRSEQEAQTLGAFDRWLAEHDRQVKATERRRIMRKVRSVLGDSGAFGFLGEFEGVLDSIEHEVSKK